MTQNTVQDTKAIGTFNAVIVLVVAKWNVPQEIAMKERLNAINAMALDSTSGDVLIAEAQDKFDNHKNQEDRSLILSAPKNQEVFDLLDESENL